MSPEEPPLSPQALQDAAGMFGMLAATARLHIMWLLAQGERDVGTLAAETGQTVAAASQHLAKLKLAGLVLARRDGRRQIYLAADPHIVELVRLAFGPRAEPGSRTRGLRGA
ncbi:ArsR/SmtB family transcription factor [Amycolatopsis sp. H20-H5]|uniref:ArsR/SmtB family transcription factor n=1 Tax=Amycolatopsis sp. H20-H5 TaxID=3046309 RepID=UPI002DBB1F65|nr:metalloregulator ArsR/SmtB family transcription factor [Amycolatopsis sp. H20-H5]MEC3980483.1 metalloregulator ArsR/SmtB family transcription factor [Amycolatopsis sp. H20-H5]